MQRVFSCLDVVKQKYPLTHRMALRKARDSANQLGRERKSYLKNAEVVEHRQEVSETPTTANNQAE